MNELCRVAIGAIMPSPIGMRSVDRGSSAYQGLLSSIKERGMLGAITVRQTVDCHGSVVYEILDGLHRYQACKDAGESWVNVNVVDLSDDQVLETQIMSSVHRVETKPIDYTNHLKRMLSQNPHLTLGELAKKLCKSTQWLCCRLSLGKIENQAAKNLINNGQICLTNAYGIAKLPPEEQGDFIDRAMTLRPEEFMPLISDRIRKLRLTSSNKPIRPDYTPEKIKKDMATLREKMAEAHRDHLLIDRSWGTVPIELLPREIILDKSMVNYEKDPLTRSGWDHVKQGKAAYGYCRGDVLVLYTGRCWAINHPRIKQLSNLDFGNITEAMEFVERLENV